MEVSACLKREGGIARSLTIMYASQKIYENCDNPFRPLAKQVKIIQGESRNRTKNDPSGGFLVGNGNLAGRASLVGYGNIAASVAHGIIDLENGGVNKNVRSVDGKIYFHPSNNPRDRVEIDLESSQFGCRKYYRDPLPKEILNLRDKEEFAKRRNECDWAVLKLRENLITSNKHHGKDYSVLLWQYRIDKDVFNSEMARGNISLITADPNNALKLYTEKNVQDLFGKYLQTMKVK